MRSYWYPDAIGTRTVFWAYATLACVGGFVLAGTEPYRPPTKLPPGLRFLTSRTLPELLRQRRWH